MTAQVVPAKGIFQLQSAQDLVSKARHDIERLRSDPLDAYAAFDFFVTVRHVPEWLYPREPSKRDRLFASHVELRICRHIADGAKHFEATHPQHKQITGTSKSSGVWGEGVWAKGAWKPGIWGDGLFISLDPSDTDTRALGSRINALELAERALAIVEKAVI
jgi:hypothetical protein